MNEQELVAGIHRSDLFNGCTFFEGFLPQGPKLCHLLGQINNHLAFRYRGHCEEDPTFKQVIPYCLITRGNELFVTRRRPNGGDARLYGKGSIGIGGHMNPVPGVPVSQLMQVNMLRELQEEVEIILPEGLEKKTEIIGMINFEHDPVSTVHVGVVYRVAVPVAAEVKIREVDKLEGSFKSLRGAIATPNMEAWSSVCLNEPLSFWLS